MKKFKYCLILVFFISSSIFSQKKYIRTIALPTEAEKLLNQEFQEWDYFNSPIPFSDSTEVCSAWLYADIIKGDFNNDSYIDYAALIKPHDFKNGFLILFLSEQGAYRLIKFKEVNYYKDQVLFLARKGSALYDFESDRTFVLPIDAITLATYEKGGISYYMSKGKFVEVITSD